MSYHQSDEHAVCRNCGLILIGKPSWQGGSAFHPVTQKRCPTNHYGGFVCSERCDYNAALTLEQSMPGHGITQTRLGHELAEKIRRRWADER
jgi:hypothetical protein